MGESGRAASTFRIPYMVVCPTSVVHDIWHEPARYYVVGGHGSSELEVFNLPLDQGSFYACKPTFARREVGTISLVYIVTNTEPNPNDGCHCGGG